MGTDGVSTAIFGDTPHFHWAGVLCKVDTQASLKRDLESMQVQEAGDPAFAAI